MQRYQLVTQHFPSSVTRHVCGHTDTSSAVVTEASAEAAHILSAISEVQSVPAPGTSHEPASIPPATTPSPTERG